MIDTRSVVCANTGSVKWGVQVALAALIASTVVGCGGGSSQPQSSMALTAAALTAAQGLEQQAYHFRQGAPVQIDLTELIGAATQYTVSPGLPSGLVLDPVGGQISGEARVLSESTVYMLSAVVDGNTESEVPFVLGLHPELPDAIEFLDNRYSARVLLANASVPVRMALAPDGRLFYAELLSGDLRIIDRDGQLLPAPFASLSIESGQEKGLLGLTLDPEFETNGFVYVYATVPSHNGAEPHAEIVRYTAMQNRAVDQTVIVDYLPVADLHNGGELLFDQSGHLFLGRGDTDEVSSAQLEGGLSGRILRYTRDGAIPEDNPYPGSAEWSRGLRNTFAMALQPETGDLFGADAGAANDDKLNYLQPGKNFVWGMEQEPQGSGIGFTVKVWEDVITPTAMFFHSGAGDLPVLKNRLFLSSYNDANIRQVVLAGDKFTDYIREVEFAALSEENTNNKPLHIMEGADGEIYLSTFDAIYHLYPH